MKLSVIIPAYNEEGCIQDTLNHLHQKLKQEGIPHELIVVNDNSMDQTKKIIQDLAYEIPNINYVFNPGPHGFGFAVRKGLDNFSGEVVTIYMADESDSPADVVKYYKKIQEGYDCVFGSRFIKGGKVVGYPFFKLVLNRIFNTLIRLLFNLRYNDTTNAFKMYRSSVIPGLKPFLSNHFNLTIELPLKCMIRGYKYAVLPNSWVNRKAGESKLKVKEMGSRYLFIMLYCFIEKWLSRSDYTKETFKAATKMPLTPILIKPVKKELSYDSKDTDHRGGRVRGFQPSHSVEKKIPPT